jgi:hypothetical protein
MRANALVLGLAGIIAVHVMDLPGKLTEAPYLGVMYVAVIAVAGFLIHRMIKGPTRNDYMAAAGLAAAVIVGYAVNRTVGMPGAMDDIGNWLEPLGLLSLVIEAWVVALGLTAAKSADLPVKAADPIRRSVSLSSS